MILLQKDHFDLDLQLSCPQKSIVWVGLSLINTKMFPQQNSPASMVTLRVKIEKLTVCRIASPITKSFEDVLLT